MPRGHRASILALPCTAASLALLPACSSTPKSAPSSRGLYVTDQTIALLKATNTDKDWITILYGTPGNTKTDKASGNETWSWDFYKYNREGIDRSAKVLERTMFIEFDTAGSIVRAWATNSDESIDEE